MNTHNSSLRVMAILVFLALIPLTTCGKDSPTQPKAPEPTPPPPTPVATRIEISPSSATFTSVGQTVQLTAGVFDQNNAPMSFAVVTWTSSSTGVATVSGQGLVTAVSNGSTTITARSGSASASVTVTVMQSVGSIAIEPASATLMSLGETVQLTATVLDQNGQPVADAVVTWMSSTVGVAKVNGQGMVTAVKNGSAQITARSGNASATTTVTVMQSVGSVVIEPSSASLMSLGETVQLTALVLDGNGQPVSGASVSWSSSDEGVATASSQGLVTAVGNGSVTITARSGSASATAEITVMDNRLNREVLVALYNSTNGPNWTNNTNWLTDAPLGDWHGVTINAWGRVTGLHLIQNNLAGTIPPELGQLRNLIALVLSHNRLSGIIPPELGQLRNLTLLSLRANELTGTIPPELGQPINLANLELQANRLAGSIPPELGQLRNLADLRLHANELTGSIPPELGQLQNLTYLYLASNQLTGPIPPELGQLRNLTDLSILANQLTGPIPPELGQLQNLTYLGPSYNFQLSGPLPGALTRLVKLKRLDLRGTQICVPPTPLFHAWLEGFESLDGLTACPSPERDALIALYHSANGPNWTHSTNWLSYAPLGEWHGVTTDARGRVSGLMLPANILSGSLPAQLGNLTALETLDLSFNAGLAGPVPFVFTGLALEALNLEGTQLCAPRTSEFQAWLDGIQRVNLADCGDTRRDSYPLTALYHGTDGPNWTHSTNWLTDAPLGSWYGVSTDAQGRVTAVRMNDNNLSGPIPSELVQLGNLRELFLSSNRLSGGIPSELGQLDNLSHLALRGNELTGSIPFELGQLDNLSHLELVGNELTGSIPSELGQLGNLRELFLSSNRLSGGIPSELGQLDNLSHLALRGNELTGSIPSELGQLGNLRELFLSSNRLSGGIPSELGQLDNLVRLYLGWNKLTGSIPSELGQLGNLRELSLKSNRLSGGIPSELGQLGNLDWLYLNKNGLTGGIPSELGQLDNLREFYLNDNGLTGGIPSELGQLQSLTVLNMSFNSLTGNVPRVLGGLSNLKTLNLNGNVRMAGTLPLELIGLGLEEFYLEGTQLCAPTESGFGNWLQTIPNYRSGDCRRIHAGLAAYLTQATQSLVNPVPLVAGEDALLRVFVTSEQEAGAVIPPVRAHFYRDGAAVHTVDMPSSGTVIPIRLDEGDLLSSANVRVPGEIIAPGLEMTIEIDPDGISDPVPGLPGRLPPDGWTPIEVADVPPLDLTLVPFLWTESPDRSVLTETDHLTAESDLFRLTRDILPVREFLLSVREPVWTSDDPNSGNRYLILSETKAIHALDGTDGHYMGIIHSGGGVAVGSGFVSVSELVGSTIAHELGHNMSLNHAPCNISGDINYPYSDGSIGTWGYDLLNGVLVPPYTPDLMSYCGPHQWISDYHFTKALRYRVSKELVSMDSAYAPSARGLLLWGGVSEEGELVLEPAFAVDAPESPPSLDGPYRIIGEDEDGGTLFRFSFGMAEIADGEGGSFAFVIPVRSNWSGRLSRIVLSGPEGVATLGDGDDRSAALLLDRATGRVRGILRNWPAPGASAQAARRTLPESGLEVRPSRGIPGSADWDL